MLNRTVVRPLTKIVMLFVLLNISFSALSEIEIPEDFKEVFIQEEIFPRHAVDRIRTYDDLSRYQYETYISSMSGQPLNHIQNSGRPNSFSDLAIQPPSAPSVHRGLTALHQPQNGIWEAMRIAYSGVDKFTFKTLKDLVNCYGYACNRINWPYGQNFGAKLSNPGEFSEQHIFSQLREGAIDASRIVAAAMSDGLTLAPPKDVPSYPIYFVLNPQIDYHWYRLDKSGLWSHKPGLHEVSNVDALGELINNPLLADHFYLSRDKIKDDPVRPDYPEGGCFFWVPFDVVDGENNKITLIQPAPDPCG